jgi:uncharacterized repeat protein (TIGR03837 family)
MRWDLYCHVIDNYGDIGFGWRLAADLAARGEQVRLLVDDASALAWMAPRGAEGVTVGDWHAAGVPGDVVVELFGCEPPLAVLAEMIERRPVWIHLDYLSAEPYVERSHGLPSPQANGLVKWFYFPGFTERTGGLLRERGLAAARCDFDRDRWLARHRITPAPGERLVSLFCYATAPVDSLLAWLGDAPTLLLLAPGPAQTLIPSRTPAPQVRTLALPWFDQAGYDRLLWSCDLNFVRGEDSFVRAQWAGAPFVWHIYPQDDGAHGPKLEAFLERFGADTEVAALWRAWNGLGPAATRLPPLGPWRERCEAWRRRLIGEADLTSRLIEFVAARRRTGGG